MNYLHKRISCNYQNLYCGRECNNMNYSNHGLYKIYFKSYVYNNTIILKSIYFYLAYIYTYINEERMEKEQNRKPGRHLKELK